MKPFFYSRLVVRMLVPGGLLVASPSVQACAVCWGEGGSKITDAMGLAILFLLGLVGLVLAGIVATFMVLARRARHFPVPADESALNL